MEPAKEEGTCYFVNSKSGHYMSAKTTSENSLVIQAQKDLNDEKQM